MTSYPFAFLWYFRELISLLLGILACLNPCLMADGPDDNHPEKVRAVPPPGIELSVEDRNGFLEKVASIRSETKRLREGILKQEGNGFAIDRDLCEIEVFARSLELTLEHSMFYSESEVKQGKELAELAVKRIADYRDGKRGWELLMATAVDQGNSKLLIGGFRSRLDGSIQPYGLVVPASFGTAKPVASNLGSSPKWKVDVWLHGRDERTSEVGFLYRRLHQVGDFAPADTIMLHPYGRYSNAFKFAGETDVLESLAHLGSLINVDENRIGMRGFSMGGAGCWQMAVHFPERWYAAAPGAGFSETTEFLRIFQKEDFQPSAVQKQLLHWYDCPDWTNNFRMLSIIAYSGELDRQKQAADVMESAFQKRHLKLKHVIGPATEHKYHPESKIEIQQQMEEWATEGRDPFPETIDLTTYTLHYPGERWIRIHGLSKHWEEARIIAKRNASGCDVTTQNIERFQIIFSEREWGKKLPLTFAILVDGQSVQATIDDSSHEAYFLMERVNGEWQRVDRWTTDSKLVKRPGLQGPIDDAFMTPFLFVLPDPSNSAKSKVDQWIDDEAAHAMKEWRRHYRGDVNMKFASQVTAEEIANKNLIVFGTPSSNVLLGRIIKQLPIAWNQTEVSLNQEKFSAADHIPVMIYPNPENLNRYIVLNSGFTFREYAYLNNARQIAMLGDWAVLDIRTPPNSRLPGKVVREGFFDERWKLIDGTKAE